VAAGLIVLAVAASLVAYRSTGPAAEPGAPSAPATPAAVQSPVAETPRPPQPAEDWDAAAVLPRRDAYAGSKQCRECHARKYEGWSRDWHAHAFAEAAPDAVVGDFRDAHYTGASSEAWMRRQEGRFVVRTRDAEGRLGDHAVRWVIGGKRMQDPLTVFEDGRWQVLPVYFHVTGRGEWVDYNEHKQGVVGPDHPFFWTNFRRTANHECLDCHTTGLDVRYERSTHRWSTEFADAGVACESCHGPGARHAETKDPKDIVHPRHVERELGLAICAQCHGPREPLFPVLDAKHRFRPGQRYDERYKALVVVDGRERSGEFFADGRPSSSSFEYQALVQSRCYRQGGATCLSCHTAPHERHGANDLRLYGLPQALWSPRALADASCFGCHAAVFVQAQRHSHHRSAEAQSCVACHMPRLVSGVLDKFPDHTMDVPAPENTVRHGVPNACGLCHEREAPQALAKALATWWPQASERQARRLRLADAIDEATAARSRPALEAVLSDRSEAPTLRGAAAELLAQRFPEAAPTALVPRLQDPGPVVRAKLLQALGYADASGAADAVAPLLADPELSVRQNAALLLASFGDPRGVATLRDLARAPETEGLVRPHLTLAMDAARGGRLDEAEAELERALALTPYHSDALVMLADLHAKKGDLGQAREELEEALRFNPRHDGALQRLSILDDR
jgi:HEAT repeat protein/tetratricopeptide repeat protein/cytochrome c554/c'-like protein